MSFIALQWFSIIFILVQGNRISRPRKDIQSALQYGAKDIQSAGVII